MLTGYIYGSSLSVESLHVCPEARVPYGTLDLLGLKTLETMGPLHGFGPARRIEQVSESLVKLNQGSIYPARMQLQQRGWIAASWCVSETNRRATFYSLTPAGRKQLRSRVENWERTATLVARFLMTEPEPR